MKKPRRKKKTQHSNESFRDEASITLPILASNLSTSISIIDIEKFQDNNEIGCPNISDKRTRKRTIIYSDDSISPSISPKNTRVFESRRIQVGDNNKAFHFKSSKHYHYPEKNEIGFKYQENINVECSVSKDEKHKEPLVKSNVESVSYPDVNLHVISMMLPGLNESLIHKSEETEKQLIGERSDNNNAKHRKVMKIEHNKDNNHRGMRTNIDVSDLQLNKGDKYQVSAKEVKVLWKYTLERDSNELHNRKTSHEQTYSNDVNDEDSEIMIKKQWNIQSSSGRRILDLENFYKCRERSDKDSRLKRVEQLYFNEKVEPTFGKNVESKSREELETDMEANDAEKCGYWMPNLMKKVQNYFSYFKGVLAEKKESTFENQKETDCKKRMNSISRIFSEKDSNEELKSEFVTLFCKENTTKSSTNFVPHIQNVTSNHSEFTLHNPYCRNYFVYYNDNNYTPTVSLPISDLKLPKKISACTISFYKQRKILNQQYSCLRDVAKVILFLTAMLRKIYKDEQYSVYPSTKCFTSIFRIRDIFRRITAVDSVDRSPHRKHEEKPKKHRNNPELRHFQTLKQQGIKRSVIKLNHSFPICCKKNSLKRHTVKDIDVVMISSNSVLLQWKVPKMLEMITKRYKIFLNNDLQCTLMYFETCAVLEHVDLKKPLLITIMTYTADGYCYSTKIRALLSAQ